MRTTLGALILVSTLAACASEVPTEPTTETTELVSATRVTNARTESRFFRAHGADPTPALAIGAKSYFFANRGARRTALDRKAESATWLYETDGTEAGTKALEKIDGDPRSTPEGMTGYDGSLYVIVNKRLPTATYATSDTLLRRAGGASKLSPVAIEGRVRTLVPTADGLYVLSIVTVTAPTPGPKGDAGTFVARVSRITHDASGADVIDNLHELPVAKDYDWPEFVANDTGFVVAANGTIVIGDGVSAPTEVATGRVVSKLHATETRFFFLEPSTSAPPFTPPGADRARKPSDLFEILGTSAPSVRGYGALAGDVVSVATLADRPIVFTSNAIVTVDTTNGTVAATTASFTRRPSTAILGSKLYALDLNANLHEIDGSPTGTKLLAKGNGQTVGSSDPAPDLIASNGALYFFDAQQKSGGETQLVRWSTSTASKETVSAFPRGARFASLRGVGSRLVFGAGGYDKELWTFDPSAPSASAAAMIETNPYGNASSNPSAFAATDSRVFFTTSEDVSWDGATDGTEQALWVTDGTDKGSRKLRNGRYGDYPGTQLEYRPIAATAGNTLCVVEVLAGYKQQMVCTDGTDAGTQLFPVASSLRPIALDGAIYFATETSGQPVSIVRFDVGTAKTSTVASLAAGSRVTRIVPRADDMLFFVASKDAASRGIWVSDGSAARTVRMVPDTNLVAATNVVVGQAGKTTFVCNEQALYATDGTATGTTQLAANIGTKCDSVRGATVGGTFVFATNSELWKVDGKTALSFWKTKNKGYFRHPVAFDGLLAFEGSDEIVTTDGTAAGTNSYRIGELNHAEAMPGGGLFVSSYDKRKAYLLKDGALTDLEPNRKVAVNGQPIPTSGGVLYAGEVDDNGMELLISNGAVGSTTVRAEVSPGAPGSHPSSLFVAKSKLFFSATGPDGDTELYAIPFVAP